MVGCNRSVSRFLGPALLLAVVAVAPGSVVAGTASVSDPFLRSGPDSRPTRAWTAFCRAMPVECRVNPLEAATIPTNPGLIATLERVSRTVNDTIVAVTDQEHWGVGDRWDFPTDGRGDCEDLQLEKRRRLVALGLPARAMRIAMVINPEGQGHAVLVVRTDGGDLVLDNRRDAVLPWHATGYVWVKREGDSAKSWVSLGGVQGPVETAGR